MCRGTVPPKASSASSPCSAAPPSTHLRFASARPRKGRNGLDGDALGRLFWNGRSGLVHEAVLADFADLSGHQVYACGAPAMIEAAKRDFTARGLPDGEFYADIFSFAAPAAAATT